MKNKFQILYLLLPAIVLTGCQQKQSNQVQKPSELIICSVGSNASEQDQYLKNYINPLEHNFRISYQAFSSYDACYSFISTYIDAGGESCLVIGAKDSFVYDFYNKREGFIIDLYSLLEQSEIAGINNNLLSNYTMDNKLLALPISWGANAVMYNQTLLEEAFGDQTSSKIDSYSNISNLLADVNTKQTERDNQGHIASESFSFGISRSRLTELLGEYCLNNEIVFPTKNDDEGLLFIKNLLRTIKGFLGDKIALSFYDENGGILDSFDEGKLSSVYYSYNYNRTDYLPTDNVDFVVSTSGDKLIGFENSICYIQSSLFSQIEDNVDLFVKRLCKNIINDDNFLCKLTELFKGGVTRGFPWLPVKDSLLEDGSKYYELLNNYSDSDLYLSLKLLTAMIKANAVNRIAFAKDSLYINKVHILSQGVFNLYNGYSFDGTAESILTQLTSLK